ncbi:MAG: glycosyltransferase [Phycisphaerae bacterium]
MNSAAQTSAVLTHHWLVARRGGEKVLAAMRELYPAAPIYTLIQGREVRDEWGDVRSSPLRFFPGAARLYPKLLPLLPLAARAVRLPDADLVLCSDAAIAKAMTHAPRSRVVCYCHSPMRYVWEPRISEIYRASLPRPLRPLWPMVCASLRRADLRASKRVDQFVANSQAVAERIRRCYGRDSVVIYPPVDLPDSPSMGPREDFYLCVGHHVVYKRLDLAVEACVRLRRRLIVIGEGPQVAPLRAKFGATSGIEFLGYQPDAVVHDHYRRARALLFAGEEDFGIVPVEAMARGCPVIALAAGGARETVIDGETGVWFASQDVDALADAMQRADHCTFDPARMLAAMQRFSRARFLDEMRSVIAAALKVRL